MGTHDALPLDRDEARSQLAAIAERRLGSGRDRRVHAAGTAGLGLTIGLLMALRNMVGDASFGVVTGLGVVVVLLGAAAVERAARTVPRRARRWSRLGFGLSMLVALVAVTPWLNLSAQDAPNTWPMVAVAALVTAVPSLVAAVAIARGGR